MVWLLWAFTMAADITKPRDVIIYEAKPFSKDQGVGEEGQSIKANLWETDWKSKSWNQNALFYSQDDELE